GREKELALLDDAWNDPNTAIFTLVAWGGVGKTALVNCWLNNMARDSYRGAERVFGWSFYSHGTREDRQASGDEFIDKALREFGDPDPSQGSPWDKGVRLANLIRRQRTLFVLDGLEPLQYPPGEMRGCLRDRGVQALVKELAHSNPGLCVITTREDIRDIESTLNATVKRIDLAELSPDAGAQLLKSLGVLGTDRELKDASREFNGHALALTLLGSYLAAVHDGDIRKRDLVPALAHDEEHGGHARRVMESYESWLKGTPELSILTLIGLFDRPADGGAVDVLKKKPVIKGLTKAILKISHEKWLYVIQHLRDLHLLSGKDERRPDTLDCHPLIREHFGEKLHEHNPAAWKEAHSRLYEYYKNLPEKEYPETLDKMQPLFIAIAHGCMAGRHQETLIDLYWKRISRREEFYSSRILGVFGAVLAGLSGFFEKPWSTPASSLSYHDKASVLNWAGFCLLALGRLHEAIQPMQTSLEVRIHQKNWKESAIDANNLSELFLTMGEVNRAVEYARLSVDYADRSEDVNIKYAFRTTLADALHQSGDIAVADHMFREAEEMQKEVQPEYPFLYSLRGYKFCDLLLCTSRYREVLERAGKTLEWVKKVNWLLDIANDTLSLGRACLDQVQEERTSDFSLAADYLNRAVDGLREAGYQYYIPQGLLARASLYRIQNDLTKARTDLDEAREIAERGGMRLYLADYHLEAARLCLAEGDREMTREHRETAKEMIDEMGYHRRDGEVEKLERMSG
ncbi:NACHT domain-containing protein, partial [Candidatus Omnitrophota bacterium]